MTTEEAIKELEKYKAMFVMSKHTMIWDNAIEIVKKIEPEIVFISKKVITKTRNMVVEVGIKLY